MTWCYVGRPPPSLGVEPAAEPPPAILAAVSLSKALRGVIDARGLRVAEVAGRFSGNRRRVTFYRVLSGATANPRVSTLVELCKVLTIGPGELLHAAGLIHRRERSLEPVDLELRRAYADLQGLSDDDKRLCLVVLRGVLKERTQWPARHRVVSGRTA